MGLVTLTNSNNMQVVLSDYGASIYSVKIPYGDSFKDVVLGMDSEDEFASDKNPCFGATIGRVANRTEKAKFELEGVTYHLEKNEGENNNHSGPKGYHNRHWEILKANDLEAVFYIDSEDGDQGFPGKVRLQVKYSLNLRNQIMIEYSGIPDKTTLINLTNHAYFNLAGADSGDMLKQELKINADDYFPVSGEDWIPMKQPKPVDDTPMDFRQAKPIGRDLYVDYSDMNIHHDYNHCYVLNKSNYYDASAYCKETGIGLKLMTNYPCVLLYTAGYIDELSGRDRCVYNAYSGFCLEAQYAPNAINNPRECVAPIVKAGQRFSKKIIYEFSW